MGKGRITSSQRKEINERAVTGAMRGEMEDVVFGRVLRHLGAGHVRVILSDKSEGIAKIRTALCKRGSTPIVADDIVVMSGREFETKTVTSSAGKTSDRVDRFDILGVLTRPQAARMEKDGKIPAWFVAADETKGDDGDIFDYSENGAGREDDDDVDVDAI